METSAVKKLEFVDVQTPCVVFESFAGTPLHCPFSALEKSELGQSPLLCAVTMRDMVFKDFGNLPLSELQKTPDIIRFLYSARDIEHGFIDASDVGVSFDAMGGRKKLTLEKYLERITLDRPQLVIALADEVDWNSTKKRLQKAHHRSMKWLKALLAYRDEHWPSTFVFGVTSTQVTSPSEIAQNAKTLLEMGANGIAIGGANLGDVPMSQLLDTIRATREAIGPGVKILIQGVKDHLGMRACIEAGADIIHSNFVRMLSSQGLALQNSFISETLNSGNEVTSANINLKKRKLEASTEDQEETREIAAIDTKIAIDVKDKCHFRDRNPLSNDCACIACRDHTRAYIHHLLMADELLGDVLIHRHNEFQWKCLLNAIKNKSEAKSNE